MKNYTVSSGCTLRHPQLTKVHNTITMKRKLYSHFKGDCYIHPDGYSIPIKTFSPVQKKGAKKFFPGGYNILNIKRYWDIWGVSYKSQSDS